MSDNEIIFIGEGKERDRRGKQTTKKERNTDKTLQQTELWLESEWEDQEQGEREEHAHSTQEVRLIYIYIYIERERERGVGIKKQIKTPSHV